jgi:hypothetical protein
MNANEPIAVSLDSGYEHEFVIKPLDFLLSMAACRAGHRIPKAGSVVPVWVDRK